MSNTGVTGGNVHPNPSKDLTKQVQKDIDKKEAMWNKARGGVSGRTIGNVKPLKVMPPIKLPSGGTQK